MDQRDWTGLARVLQESQWNAEEWKAFLEMIRKENARSGRKY
jgi:hypothetical protein